MLLHGTRDDNVFLSHTLALSDALTRSGRLHRVVPLRAQTHAVHDSKLLEGMYRTVVSFLRESLASPEPMSRSQDQGEAGTVLTGLE